MQGLPPAARRRFFIWIVAAVVAFDSLVDAVVAISDRRFPEFAIRVAAAWILFGTAAWLEIIKSREAP